MGTKLIHSNEPQDFDANIRVLAGPGAGKTYWLIGQMREILLHSERLGTCRKIACITYTNKATDNIMQQIKFGTDRIEVSTIHAFLYANVIKPYFHLIADKFGFDISKLNGHDDTIFTGYEFINSLIGKCKCGRVFGILKNKGKNLDYNEVGNYISKHRWHIENNTMKLKQSGKKYNLYGVIDESFVNAYKKDVWNQKGIMHDDDVLYFSYQLFKECPRIKRLIANKFPYILVDEYQDSSSIQHCLVQQLADAGAYLTIIGDEAQSIYSFANGDIKYIKNIQLPNLVSYNIKDNRRSTKEVVDFLNVIRPNLKQNAIREESSSIPMIIVGAVLDSYTYCSNVLRDSKGIEEPLITLSWKNETANDIKSKLTPTFTKGHLIKDVLALNDSERSRKFVACVNAVENARQKQMKDAIKYISKGFDINIKTLKGKNEAVSFLRILCSKYDDCRNDDGKALLRVIKSDLKQNISEAKRGKPNELFSNPYINFAREVKYDDEQATDMTIHKAKGLEFNNVLVVFEKENDAVNFLLSNDLEQDTQIAEEHRIYYVACSRACNRLFLSVPSLSEANRNKIERRFANSVIIEKL